MLLTMANSLRKPLIERQYFDPTNQQHLESLDAYLKTGNWGAVQFFAELPFTEVPVTVLTKYAMYERGVRAETSEERTARLESKTLVRASYNDERETRMKTANDILKVALQT